MCFVCSSDEVRRMWVVPLIYLYSYLSLTFHSTYEVIVCMSHDSLGPHVPVGRTGTPITFRRVSTTSSVQDYRSVRHTTPLPTLLSPFALSFTLACPS